MMLATLTDIAQQFGLTFLYGEKKAFNILADYTDPNLIVFYHEGYVSGQIAEDQQGAWDRTYNVRLWLLLKNTGSNDMPPDRLPRFENLEPLMYRILSKISQKYSVIGPVSFSEGIEQADQGLDGFRFVANVKEKEPVAYCE
ncbi:hypothetical protein GO755_39080 [Spirosoma sp. HMF4905]|uniref:DUF3168 domain-containing protein n=1 Tax=Spirosoma arboris TaxID=2682092 RepID=A0A7K1SQV7_9BACT|nr:hypothetical protein [Spirosoma arboris]MVM36083.1 hypothetical protein [Spirosoma arboris]